MTNTSRREDTKSNQVSEVVQAGLCHSCGACQAVCPVDAIRFRESVGGQFYPAIDDELCTECGLCLTVCAGIASNSSLGDALPQDPFTGVCLESWVGRACDPAVYTGGQSGGVVSQILLDLLDSGEVDACAVVRMPAGNPPRPSAVLARGRQEILEAQKSKYCPVPVLEILREAKRKNWRIAMVGLSCHFHALSLIENTRIDVASIVKLRVGLICERVLTLAALDYLVARAQQGDSRAKLVFKDKCRTGYPGDVTVQDDGGNVSIVPRSERMAIKDLFTPARCRLCFDKMNVLADVTVGDPWGIEEADKENGESVVVARTDAGRSAVSRAAVNGHLSLRPVAYDAILEGQGIDRKRIDWRAYSDVWKETGRPVPGFYTDIVAHAARPERRQARHRRQLRRALQLDLHRSREQLLRRARRTVVLARLRKYIQHALRLIRRLPCK